MKSIKKAQTGDTLSRGERMRVQKAKAIAKNDSIKAARKASKMKSGGNIKPKKK